MELPDTCKGSLEQQRAAAKQSMHVFSVGDAVLGKYGATRVGADWFKGTVSAVRSTNDEVRYNIDYDDGKKEKGVPKRLVRRFRPPPSKTEYVLAAGELPDMLGGACREVRYLLMRSFGVHLFYVYETPVLAAEKGHAVFGAPKLRRMKPKAAEDAAMYQRRLEGELVFLCEKPFASGSSSGTRALLRPIPSPLLPDLSS